MSANAPDGRYEPGLRPLPWPLFQGRDGTGRALGALAAGWTCSLLLAIGLGYLSLTRQWHNYPLGGGWRLGFYPPWTLALLWTLWFGWGYGAALSAVSRLLLAVGLTALELPAALALSLTDAAGLWVFQRILHALPPDPRLRTLRDAAIFATAAFLASAAGANGAFAAADGSAAFELWQAWWLGHFFEALILAGPLATLLGPALERWKAARFASPAVVPTHNRLAWGLLASGLTLIVFYSVWMQAAGARMRRAIDRYADAAMQERLMSAHRADTLQRGAIMATLFGLLGIGAWLLWVQKRRHEQRLDEETRAALGPLKRRQRQLQILHETAGDLTAGLERAELVRRLAGRLQRMVAPGVACVYAAEGKERLRCLAREGNLAEGIPGEAGDLAAQALGRSEAWVLTEGDAQGSALARFGARGYLAVPLQSARGACGVLEAWSEQPLDLDEADRRFLALLGWMGGTALEGLRSAGLGIDALYRLSQDLAEQTDSTELLKMLVAGALPILRAESAAGFLPVQSAGGDVFLQQVAVAGRPRNFPEPPSVAWDDPGLAASCAREGRARTQVRETGRVGLIAPGWTAGAALAIPVDAGEADERGALVFAFSGPWELADAEHLAGELTHLASAGLRRVRLIEATRRQAAEIALLEHIGRTLSGQLSTGETLSWLVRHVAMIFPTPWALVLEYDEAAQELVARAATIPHPDAAQIRIPVGARSLCAECFRCGRMLVASDLRGDERSSPELNLKYGTGSGVAVPLGPEGAPVGVLFATGPEPRNYTDEETRRLEQVAALATAALERSRLHEAAQGRAQELALLNEVSGVLVEHAALEFSLDRIAEVVRRHFQAAGAGFLLKDAQRDELVVRGAAGLDREAGAGVPAGAHEPIARAIREGKALGIEDREGDPYAESLLRNLSASARSGVLVPMSHADGNPGVLGVFDTRTRRFRPDELRRLEAVARLAAAAVERGELGQALELSQARLMEVLEHTPAIVIGLDLQGRVLSFNATAERLTGFSRQEAIGKDAFELFFPEPAERQEMQAVFAGVLAKDGTLRDLATNLHTKGGARLRVRWSSEPIRASDGKMSGVVGMGIDVTEQVQLEEQFLQAQKMETVGAMAGGMAHDFNNLLGGILGQSALARAQLNPRDPIQKVLGKIEAAAQRGADLTGKLLAFARHSVIEPAPVDAGLLLRETAELLAGSLPREITVISQAPPHLPRIEGDATQLQQVLLNLCVNARDAMPEGGTLTLRASIGEPGEVLLEVADTGTGMSDEVKGHLFEPFFTTKEKGKGTGLGLAVVFGVVRSHGGRVEVESRVGAGTRFLIRLPAMKEHATPEVAVEPEELQPVLEDLGGNESVLLVDDEAIMRETTQSLLQHLGYDVQVAASGEEALHLLDQDIVSPHVIVLDVIMPGLSGVALYEELRNRCPNAPVILVSGFSRELEVQRLLHAGALELIQKPFQIDTLAAAIRRAIQNALRHAP